MGMKNTKKEEFNGYKFNDKYHRRQMKFIVIQRGDLDINNAYAFRNKRELVKFMKEGSLRENLAFLRVKDITTTPYNEI